jgi:hypothetical protein
MYYAYDCCQANGGAAGVDGQKFEDIEAYGVERWLDELMHELKSRTYQPLSVRRVYIPKPDGKQRPLGVSAIRDRTAQMAAVLILEPIFETDLPPEQYAYRRDRSALDAVNRVHKLIYAGHQEIVDADLSSSSPQHDSAMEPEGVDRVSHAEIDSTLPGSGADAHATQCPAKDRATDQGTESDLAGMGRVVQTSPRSTLFHKLDGWIVRRIWSHRFCRWRSRGLDRVTQGEAVCRIWLSEPHLSDTFPRFSLSFTSVFVKAVCRKSARTV